MPRDNLIPPLLGYFTMAGGEPVWTPASISGLALWFDFSDATTMFTDDGTTPVSTTGDLIYRANDKSVNVKHAVQATENIRPEYTTNQINGLSSCRFTGTSDKLTMASATTVATATIFIVLDVVSAASYSIIIDGQEANKSAIGTQYSGVIRASTQTSGYVNLTDNQLGDGIFSFVYNGSTFKIYKNGTDVTSGTPSGTGNWIFSTLGCFGTGSTMNVGIGEFIAYSGALTDANRQLVEAYLTAKWVA